MSRFLLILSLGVLAACSGTGDGAEPVAQEAAGAPSAESVAGRYRVVRSDGSGFISVINADGTYSEVVDGKTTVTGRWQSIGEGTCYDPDDAEPTCYTFGEPAQPAEEGAFSARSDKGEVFTVRRIEE